MGRNNMSRNKEKIFEVADFDRRVAESISLSMNRIAIKKKNKDFINWVGKREEHLYNMYLLSGDNIDIETFYRFIYNNSIPNFNHV